MEAISMKRCIPFVFLAACGSVVDADAPATPDPVETLEVDPEFPYGPTATVNPLMVEAPIAATGPASLFSRTFPNNAAMGELFRTIDATSANVLEQRFQTTVDQPVVLDIEMPQPTGSYASVIVSDALQNGGTYTDLVLCEQNNVATFDPRCNTGYPRAFDSARAGALTTSTWTLTLIDEQTGAPSSSCVSSGTNKLHCALPGLAGARYRLVVAATGFSDVWGGTDTVVDFLLKGIPFTGAFAKDYDWACWDWRVTTNAMYCAARYQYVRFSAIDQARIDLDPITIQMTANGAVTSMTSPALTWDTGNDDVPGTPY